MDETWDAVTFFKRDGIDAETSTPPLNIFAPMEDANHACSESIKRKTSLQRP
jgi:hypothetical protein